MSDSDRGKRSKAELVAFAGIAATFIVAILVWAIPAHLSYSNQASYNAEYHQRWVDEQIRRDCISVPAIASERCVDQANAASEERQREERDLEAQQKMALWTAIMGAMAVVGVGLSGFGVYLIWRTWDATREAAENSRKTLNAYIAKERAFIRVVEAVFQSDQTAPDGQRDGFYLKIKNVGLSTAKILEIAWQYRGDDKWKPDLLTYHCRHFFVPPGETESASRLGAPIFDDPTYLSGWIKYETLVGERFKSYFCCKIEFINMENFGPNQWIAKAIHLPALPYDT